MIAGLGLPELLVILVVALLIFGPKNLPKLGKSLGQTVKNVREGMEGDDDDAKPAEPAQIEAAEDVPAPAPMPVAEPVVEAVEVAEPAVEEDVVFCNECGAKNPASAKFCNGCGAKLA